MIAIRNLIITTLQNDSVLGPSVFPGGVWPRLPRQGTGRMVTPGAFYGSENPEEAGKLKPTIAVIDGGNDPSPGGVAHNGFVAFPLVYGFAIANPAGEASLDLLEERLHTHFPLRGAPYPLGLRSVEMKTLEKQQQREADDIGYPGRVFAIWRIQGTFVR
jgi:hypothetical protein